MKKVISILAAMALFMTSALAQNLMVGAAKVDVTPSEKDLVRSTDSIRGKLYVKAVYISNGRVYQDFLIKDRRSCRELHHYGNPYT